MKLDELIDRISVVRTRANLSARKLSQNIGKTDSYIHHMEQTRKFAPSFATLCDILEVCGSSFEEFFYHDIAAYKQDQEILTLLRAVSPEKRSLCLQLLKVK